jgi:hypothetical protein
MHSPILRFCDVLPDGNLQVPNGSCETFRVVGQRHALADFTDLLVGRHGENRLSSWRLRIRESVIWLPTKCKGRGLQCCKARFKLPLEYSFQVLSKVVLTQKVLLKVAEVAGEVPDWPNHSTIYIFKDIDPGIVSCKDRPGWRSNTFRQVVARMEPFSGRLSGNQQ